MRIAYFVDGFPLVSETFILAQVAGMVHRGHEVTIFANKKLDRYVSHAALERYNLLEKVIVRPVVPGKRLPRLRLGVSALVSAAKAGRIGPALATLNVFRFGIGALGMKLLIRARAHFRHDDFDVLHCQFGQLGIEVADLRRCGVLKGTLITSFRGADATRVASRRPDAFQDLFATGDLFLAVSASIRDVLVELGCPAKKIAILRSGIDLSQFGYRGPRNMNSPIRLVTIGRLGPTKGHEYALDAVRILLDAGLPVDYRIVGDGKRLGELTQYAAERDLDAVVTFEGAVDSDRIVKILHEADVLIAPSIVAPTGQTEGVPNVLKEAMACGVPVIGTRVGGVAELIDHGRNGFLVPQKDAGAIAESVRAIIAQQESMPQMLAAARQSIEQDYDVRQLNADLEDIYLCFDKVQ